MPFQKGTLFQWTLKYLFFFSHNYIPPAVSPLSSPPRTTPPPFPITEGQTFLEYQPNVA